MRAAVAFVCLVMLSCHVGCGYDGGMDRSVVPCTGNHGLGIVWAGECTAIH